MRFRFFILTFIVLGTSVLFAQKEGFEYVNRPITIVVLGSSTAEGIGTCPRDSSWVNRYRVYVQTFNPNNQVINLGKGGFSTYQVQPTADEYLRNRPNPDTTRNLTKALEYKPDGIILNLPSNDVADGNSIEEQLNNFRTLAALAEENNIELWVCTTQARNFPKAKDRRLQRNLYDSIRGIFYNNYIDFWTGFCDLEFKIHPQYDSGDGCHMNNGAHEILMNRVIEAQAFAGKLDATAIQRSTNKKPKEQKSPYLRTLGFDGVIERALPLANTPSRVEIVQSNKVKAITEVNDSLYNVEVEVDLRLPVTVVYRDSNVLTKMVEFNFLELAFSQKTYAPYVFYPVESLDIVEIPLEMYTYRFPLDEFTVARFDYDSTEKVLRMDKLFVSNQQQRMEDAFLKSGGENKVKLYWPNGEKQAVLKFKNGSLHGKSIWYRESGEKVRIVYFSIGKYYGKYIDFDEAGNKKMLRNFVDDREMGEAVLY